MEDRLVNVADPNAISPIEGFVHDVDFTRFASRSGVLAITALAIGVATAAKIGGPLVALGAASAGFVVLAVAILVLERDRWRAQDVVHWWDAGWNLRWRADTGSSGPVGGVAAEIWLGVHPRGTVPQLYRVLAAYASRDMVVWNKEASALALDTPGDRLIHGYVIERARWLRTGVADTAALGELLRDAPDGKDHDMVHSWIAEVRSADRWQRHERDWMRPLVDEWPQARRYPMSVRHRARMWESRVSAIVAFILEAAVFTLVVLLSR